MGSPIKPTRPAAWIGKQALADVLDVTVGYFDREVRRYVSPAHVRRDGKRLLFYARGVLDAWYSAKLRPPATAAADDDLAAELEVLLLGLDAEPERRSETGPAAGLRRRR
jgi:hypothetical protein